MSSSSRTASPHASPSVPSRWRASKGVKVGKFRLITAWPFPEKKVKEIAARTNAIVVAEINLGQMVREVERAVAGEVPVRFVGHAGGSVHKSEDILKAIMEVAR